MNLSTTTFARIGNTFVLGHRRLRWLLFLVLFCAATHGLRAQTVYGDGLDIGGDGLVSGNLSAGTFFLNSDQSDYVLYSMSIYAGTSSSNTTSYVNMLGVGTDGTVWSWGGVTSGNQMTLDETNVLSLYSTGGNLVMDPGNQSLFFNDDLAINEGNSSFAMSGNSGNIVFNPNAQTIHFSSGLTFNGSSGNWTVFAGSNGFAVGTGAAASGNYSAAFGGEASATNLYTVALANGTASGIGSVGIAQGSASGDWSVALIGGTTSANATDGFALGSGAYANATSAIALGNGTTAQAWSSVTVGHYNANITGNNTTLVATDPAFIVGVGGNTSTRANGLVVLNNGNTTIGGNLSVSGNVTGNVTITGNVTVTQPQGDIPMGMYGGD